MPSDEQIERFRRAVVGVLPSPGEDTVPNRLVHMGIIPALEGQASESGGDSDGKSGRARTAVPKARRRVFVLIDRFNPWF